MDYSEIDDAGVLNEAHAHWPHELRNVVNTAGVTVALAKRLMDRGDGAAAKEMIGNAENAWARCRDLLADADRLPALDVPMRDFRPAGEAGRRHHAPPPHR